MLSLGRVVALHIVRIVSAVDVQLLRLTRCKKSRVDAAVFGTYVSMNVLVGVVDHLR